jgi:hypothetical protein
MKRDFTVSYPFAADLTVTADFLNLREMVPRDMTLEDFRIKQRDVTEEAVTDL